MNKIKDIFSRGVKHEIIEIINTKTDLIDCNCIIHYLINIDIEIVKFIFEYCEKINKKIDASNILLDYCVSYDLWKYILFLKKHNYCINLHKIYEYTRIESPPNIYCLNEDYFVTKNIRKHLQENKRYKYIYNNIGSYFINSVCMNKIDYLIRLY